MSPRRIGRLALLGTLGLVLALAGCAPAPGTEAAPPAAGAAGYVRTVRAEEADLWRGQNYRGLLLDVRNLAEWDDPALGHFENATLVPLAELEARLPEIAAYRTQPVLVYDKDGPRALAGAQALARNGFRDVSWLDGGLVAYRKFQQAP